MAKDSHQGVVATWTKDMEFAVEMPGGETLNVASVPWAKRPGSGGSPVELVQAALACCTGIDIVLILQKMRKELEGLRMEVQPVRRDEEPRIYTELKVVFHIDGKDLDAKSVARAAGLSFEKYCSVGAMLRPTVELKHEIVLNGEPLAVVAS